MKINEEPIIVEQTFSATVDAVWNAKTEIDQMRKWYFESIPSFEPEAGFETRFNVESQERNFTHLWKVKEAIPGKMITYNWKYEEYPRNSLLVKA